jgi:MFS transporter, ACS family, hexuronate transporter
MGLFAAYMGVGQVIIYNLAPRILPGGGWQGAWWFSTLYTAAFIVVWILLMIRLRAFTRRTPREPARDTAPATSLFKNKSLWGLASSMGLYVASYVSIQMFLPSYLSASHGMSLADASGLTSVCCFLGTVFSLVAGKVSDVLGSRRVLGGACLLAGAALFVLIPFTPVSAFLPLIIILGIIPVVLPVCVFAAASEAFPGPEKSVIAMGLITLGQNIGFTAGPLLFGTVAEALGWNMAFFAMITLAAVGGILMLRNRRVR